MRRTGTMWPASGNEAGPSHAVRVTDSQPEEVLDCAGGLYLGATPEGIPKATT